MSSPPLLFYNWADLAIWADFFFYSHGLTLVIHFHVGYVLLATTYAISFEIVFGLVPLIGLKKRIIIALRLQVFMGPT